MAPLLVIFDLDGTLVDSETLCNQAFLDLLPALTDTVEAVVERYRGKKLADTLRDFEDRLGTALPDNFEKLYRQRVAELFVSDLKPVDGVLDMLGALEHPFCIASSGPPEKIAQALALTGLAPHFGDRIFSAYSISSWKPDPGLFLHAAAAMGFAPKHCVVVEDSPVGLQAAAAAGMRALHYAPDAPSATTFTRMALLPSLLQKMAAGGTQATAGLTPPQPSLAGVHRSQRVGHDQLRGHIRFIDIRIALALGVIQTFCHARLQPSAVEADGGRGAVAHAEVVGLQCALHDSDQVVVGVEDALFA